MQARLFFLSLLFNYGFFTTTYSQTKHALIFAIGNYPDWPKISSLRDVGFIETALKKQNFQDIKVVSDSSATVKGISDALDNLIDRVKPGDVVVIHFSTHGEQIEDDNGDETDGLDETIVTYNAVLPPDGPVSKNEYDKFQVNYFRDDKFGAYIDKLRAKLGKDGDVVVFMDLCHSGTGTRGFAKVRGGQPALVTKEFDPTKYSVTNASELFKEKDIAGVNDNDLATYIVYSAAEASELNYETEDNEGQNVGSLTYAICKVLSNLDTNAPSYRSLFSAIQTVMNVKSPNQHPVLEGTGLDRILFGGKFLKQLPYIEIEKITGTKLILKAGKIQGLDSGAKVVVYPAGTFDTTKATKLASGTVVMANSYSSKVNLDKDPAIKQTSAAWVFISEPVYNIEPLGISIVGNSTRGKPVKAFSQAEITTFKNSLLQLPLLRFDINPDLIIVKGEKADSIKIASNGCLFSAVTNTLELKADIQKYVQYKFLQGLDIKDKNINVEVKLVPFINGIPDTAYINKESPANPEFADGDKFVLWVKNSGDASVYFNILDMQPDGIINKVFPDKQKDIYPGDLKIAASSSFLFSQYPITVSPPYGTEIFKVFVSKQKIDMEDIANTKGTGTRGQFTVLENLVKTSYQAGTRGVETNNISNADGSCFNLLFQIKPKKSQ